MQRLISAGLIEVLLSLLNQCEDEEFDTVRNGGDVVSPVNWITILDMILEDDTSYAMEVAQNIGPLTRCMCDYNTRMMYKRNVLWYESVASFLALLSRLIQTKETVTTVIENEGLMDFLMQCPFWRYNRPDIIHEIESFEKSGAHNVSLNVTVVECALMDIVTVVECALMDIAHIIAAVSWQMDYDEETSATCLYKFGTTTIPIEDEGGIVRKTPFIVALFKLMDSVQMNRGTQECINMVLSQLIGSNCVDKDVISGVINYGLNSQPSDGETFGEIHLAGGCRDAYVVCQATCEMLITSPMKPNDIRYAFALRNGLFEMCIHFITTFGDINDIWKEGTMWYLNNLLQHANAATIMKKTNKAVRDQRGAIQEALQKAKGIHWIPSNQKIQELLSIIQSILDTNENVEHFHSPYCQTCQNNIEAGTEYQCSKCNTTCYCCKTCQVNDWLSHKGTCKQIRRMSRNDRDKAAARVNAARIGMKIFAANATTCILQAILKGCDILDCVVIVNVVTVPSSIHVELRSEFIQHNFSSTDRKEAKETFGRSPPGTLNIVFFSSSGMIPADSSLIHPDVNWSDEQSGITDAWADELALLDMFPNAKQSFLDSLMNVSDVEWTDLYDVAMEKECESQDAAVVDVLQQIAQIKKSTRKLLDYTEDDDNIEGSFT